MTFTHYVKEAIEGTVTKPQPLIPPGDPDTLPYSFRPHGEPAYVRFDPAWFVMIPAFLFGVVAHECAHAAAAAACGDPTPRERGRLTLHPFAHLDLVGSLLVPGVLLATHAPALLGWGRAVPLDGARLRDPRNGRAWVAAAGPLANLLLAMAFAVVARFSPAAGPIAGAAFAGVVANLALALFHLLPIPPLDGAWLLMRFLRLRDIIALHHVRPAAFLVLAALVLSPYTSAAVLGVPVRAAGGLLGLLGGARP